MDKFDRSWQKELNEKRNKLESDKAEILAAAQIIAKIYLGRNA